MPRFFSFIVAYIDDKAVDRVGLGLGLSIVGSAAPLLSNRKLLNLFAVF